MRPVIQGERGALAGAIERLVLGERGLAALDIGRRQRPQRPRHLAESQVRKMPLLQGVEKNWETQVSSMG